MHGRPALLWKQWLRAAEGDKQGKHQLATVQNITLSVQQYAGFSHPESYQPRLVQLGSHQSLVSEHK